MLVHCDVTALWLQTFTNFSTSNSGGEMEFVVGKETFTHSFGAVLGGLAGQGRGVTPDRLMTLWTHSCMLTQCDSPDMA